MTGRAGLCLSLRQWAHSRWAAGDMRLYAMCAEVAACDISTQVQLW